MLVLSCLIGQVTMAWRLSLPYPTSPLSSLHDFVFSVLVMEMGLTSVQKKNVSVENDDADLGAVGSAARPVESTGKAVFYHTSDSIRWHMHRR